jgi:hypothetical protein
MTAGTIPGKLTYLGLELSVASQAIAGFGLVRQVGLRLPRFARNDMIADSWFGPSAFISVHLPFRSLCPLRCLGFTVYEL